MASFAFFATWGPQAARTPSAFVGAVTFSLYCQLSGYRHLFLIREALHDF